MNTSLYVYFSLSLSRSLALSFAIVRLYLCVSHQSDVQYTRVHLLSHSKVSRNSDVYTHVR